MWQTDPEMLAGSSRSRIIYSRPLSKCTGQVFIVISKQPLLTMHMRDLTTTTVPAENWNALPSCPS